MYVFQMNDAITEESTVEATALQGPASAAKIMMGELAQRWSNELIQQDPNALCSLQVYDTCAHVRVNGQLSLVVEMYQITNIIHVPDSPALKVTH